MIELNFWGLDYNLRKNIIKRGGIDYIETIFPINNFGRNHIISEEDYIIELQDVDEQDNY